LDAALKRIGELTMENELLRAKMETPGPLGRRTRVCGRWAYFGLIRDLVVLKSLRLFGWQSGFQAQKCGHTN
jgi:hypothetical protein